MVPEERGLPTGWGRGRLWSLLKELGGVLEMAFAPGFSRGGA